MIAQQILLAIIGLTAGLIVSGGLIAFIITLGIIPRYAGITHSAQHIFLYEDIIFLGAIAGNLVGLYQLPLVGGMWGLGIYGLFSGIYLGSWVIALAEITNIFPIMSRRFGITKGIGFIILSIAIGKVVGALFFFSKIKL